MSDSRPVDPLDRPFVPGPRLAAALKLLALALLPVRLLLRLLGRSLPLPVSRSVKRVLPRGLFGRALLIIVTPAVLLQVLATWFFFDRHWETVSRRLAFAAAGEVALFVNVAEESTSAPARTLRLNQLRNVLQMQSAGFSPGARLLGEPDDGSDGEMLQRALVGQLRDRLPQDFRVVLHPSEQTVEIDVQLQHGVLTVVTPDWRFYAPTNTIFVWWLIGSAVVLFAVAILFMRNQIRPIRRLAEAAELFGKGRDVPGFKPEGALEVRQAARAFQQMRDRIHRQIRQRTEMLAGVSHDLRTPLTRMKLQLEMLPAAPEVEDLKGDVQEMEQMVGAYLAFARGEGGEAPQPIDLRLLLQEVVEGANRSGGSAVLVPGADAVLSARPQAIKRCLGNLVMNARRHAPHVWVSLAVSGGNVIVLVDDDGPGLPQELREKVFRPFFRAEPSRNSATGGSGLGLTIARDVARGHGGDVQLEQSPAGGLRAVVRLPL